MYKCMHVRIYICYAFRRYTNMLSLSDTIYRKEKAHMAIVKDVDQDTAVHTYKHAYMHCISYGIYYAL